MKNSFTPARAALLLAAGMTFATPVTAQNAAAFDAAATNATTAPLRAALQGTPSQIKASELDASWRRFQPVIVTERYESSFRNVDLFTRGETLAVGSQTFLIAYRAPKERRRSNSAMSAPFYDDDMASNATDVDVADDSQPGDIFITADGYGRLLSDDTLRLVLINAATLGAMADVRAFDNPVDVIDNASLSQAQQAQARSQIANQVSVVNLKQIGLGLIQYTQDYDEKYPPMRSAQSMAQIKSQTEQGLKPQELATVQGVLNPYIRNTEVFAHPTTREIYRPNLNLSGRSQVELDVTSRVVAFYEASPAADGTRAVLYADGHVKRERETDWPRIRAASDAIAPPFVVRKRATNAGTTGATVTLTDAAAMAYMIRRQRDDQGRPQQVYVSRSTGRIYYRDAQTKQAIWLSSPGYKTAPGGITIPASQAREFREFQGYNGQTVGRVLDPRLADPVVSARKIKLALSANAALNGSQISVDTLDDFTVVVRGTATSRAQKERAEAIARQAAPRARIENQLVVNGS